MFTNAWFISFKSGIIKANSQAANSVEIIYAMYTAYINTSNSWFFKKFPKLAACKN